MQHETQPPETTLSHFERIGGSDKIRKLTKRFYQIMDELAEVNHIRQMHPKDLQSSEDKLFKFLNGWMGGPQLYVQEYGHPMLRRRHMIISIGRLERDQWMQCMNLALAEVVDNIQLRTELSDAFSKVADHMRNTN